MCLVTKCLKIVLFFNKESYVRPEQSNQICVHQKLSLTDLLATFLIVDPDLVSAVHL